MVIDSSLMMGSDYYETLEECEYVPGCVPMGVGDGAVIRRVRSRRGCGGVGWEGAGGAPSRGGRELSSPGGKQSSGRWRGRVWGGSRQEGRGWGARSGAEARGGVLQACWRLASSVCARRRPDEAGR